MPEFEQFPKARMSTGAFCVYRHFLPGASVPFHIGSGALSTGSPYRFGASRALKWHRCVVESGHSADQVIVEIVSCHDSEQTATEARERYLATYPRAEDDIPSVKSRPLTTQEAAALFSAMKQC